MREQPSTVGKRKKSALAIASAALIGIAAADYANPLSTPVSATFCCVDSWECWVAGAGTWCETDLNCAMSGPYFGRCIC